MGACSRADGRASACSDEGLGANRPWGDETEILGPGSYLEPSKTKTHEATTQVRLNLQYLQHSRSVRDAEFKTFLSSGSRLAFEECSAPVVTAIMVAWNHAELSFGCLRALRQAHTPLEVVIVDNASTDKTDSLLERVDGARVIRNHTNLGFTLAVNQGADVARGKFLLFINNDAEPLPGALERLVEHMSDETVGAVGGKLVWPSGRLQEAGVDHLV
jgi:hypothetical protein